MTSHRSADYLASLLHELCALPPDPQLPSLLGSAGVGGECLMNIPQTPRRPRPIALKPLCNKHLSTTQLLDGCLIGVGRGGYSKDVQP